jgi:hypothetical protein
MDFEHVLEEGVMGGMETPSSRRPARISSASPSRVTAITMVFVAALLCAKLVGPGSSAAPSAAARELAVHELLTAASGQQRAYEVKTAKMSAIHAALQSNKPATMIKDVQKLEEAPAKSSAEAPAAISQQKLDEAEAPAADAPVEAGAPTSEEGMGVVEAGWDKGGWSVGDWASWIITGPFITVCFAFFMFYTYGVPAGVLTAIICACIDVGTFYYNW